ncbi:hypothetical protein B0T20DRAFT_389586 [Sordaria brevicollis]|uniref:Secreted protein n=1 Tax=Sordaria brevicollis TaxID=83679 RepID=A0AAE0UEU8_SORBR|nr:hypothetical protein B0T20DRAFT_389586 [Sordaria brevicollis]
MDWATYRWWVACMGPTLARKFLTVAAASPRTVYFAAGLGCRPLAYVRSTSLPPICRPPGLYTPAPVRLALYPALYTRRMTRMRYDLGCNVELLIGSLNIQRNISGIIRKV